MGKKCNICNYRFTSHKRVPISCEQCKSINCLNCFEKWLLEPLNIQVCIYCKEPINNLILWRNCTKKFLKLYFKKLSYLELEEQKKLMLRLEEKQMIKELNKKLEEHEKSLRLQLKENKTSREIFKLLYETSEKILENNIILENSKDESNHKTTKCIRSECSGYLIKNKCLLCETFVCNKCNEVKEINNHVCNPESVKSIEEIKRSTKNCPKCDVSIHKIDGCDQMFCVQCHTAFSWSTNKIDTSKRIHNPHYFEYISKIQQSYQIYDENESLNNVLNEIILQQRNEMFYIPRLIQECSAVITSLNNFLFNSNVIKICRNQNVKKIFLKKQKFEEERNLIIKKSLTEESSSSTEESSTEENYRTECRPLGTRRSTSSKLGTQSSTSVGLISVKSLEDVWFKSTTFYIKKKFLCLEVLDILSVYLQEVKNIVILWSEHSIKSKWSFNTKSELKHNMDKLDEKYNNKLLMIEKKHNVKTKTCLRPFQCKLVHWDNDMFN